MVYKKTVTLFILITGLLIVYCKAAEADTFTHTFNQGWNLVSFPFTPTASTAEEMFGSSYPNSIFIFENGSFLSVGQSDPISFGKSYWVYYDVDKTITFQGTAFSSTSFDTTICSGWNLIPFPFMQTENVSSMTFNSIPVEGNLSLYIYDNATNTYQISSSIDSWSSFWINASSTGTFRISIPWAKKYGPEDYAAAYSIIQTNDSGYIVAGYTANFISLKADFWILKLDSNGEQTWGKKYGGIDADVAYSIQQTSDNGYIVTGSTVNHYYEKYDIMVLKLDANGNQSWVKIFGGSKNDTAYSIQQTSDGGYIVAGYTESYGAGGDDLWILKLDSNGEQVWTKTFGGAENEEAESIQQTSDGGYIVAGWTGSFGSGQMDWWVLKLDSNGEQVWAKTFGGAGWEWAVSIQQTNDGGYIVAGPTDSIGSGGYDFWVLKLDSNGEQLWAKTFGGAKPDIARSIQQTNDGGYIVAGPTLSFGSGDYDIWILKLDSNGEQVWEKTFGGAEDESAYSIQQTSDGGYIVAGWARISWIDIIEFLVVKIDKNGECPGCF